MLHKYLS